MDQKAENLIIADFLRLFMRMTPLEQRNIVLHLQAAMEPETDRKGFSSVGEEVNQ